MPTVSFSQVIVVAIRAQQSARVRVGDRGVSSMWYSPEEDRMMRQAWVNDIRRMRRKLRDATRGGTGVAISQADLEECVGVDACLNPSLINQVILHRQAHTAAILREQAVQREGGPNEIGSEILYHVSLNSSSWARTREVRQHRLTC